MLGSLVGLVHGAPPGPFVQLYDTRAASRKPLAPAAVTRRAGWLVVPEGKAAHAFAGDAVFANDRLAIAVRAGGDAAEVYSLSPGPRLRAALGPHAADGSPASRLRGVRIVENTPAAVAVAATWATGAGEELAASVRLTMGVGYVEVKAGKGVAGVMARGDSRHVVVPDFFADDMVFAADSFNGDRLPLPAENQLLSLSPGGDAMLMAVWASNEQGAELICSKAGVERAIRGCRIDCRPGGKVWFAVLTGKGLWHAREVGAAKAGGDLALDWRPPHAAKWRATLCRADGVGESWNFAESAAADDPNGPPCWFDAGRPVVRIDRFRWLAGAAAGRGKRLVVYPIDRSRATPLTVFCPIDVMRNTLGVGACQYVLAVEGLGGEDPPTPADVTRWVEKQFQRKRAVRSAEAIRERLAAMGELVGRTRARLGEYRVAAGRLRRLCEGGTGEKEPAARLLAIVADIERSVAAAPQGAPDTVKRLAESMAGLIGQAGATERCRRLGREIRAVGAGQDRALARGRMAVRRLRAACRAAGGSELAAAVGKEVDGILRRKGQ